MKLNLLRLSWVEARNVSVSDYLQMSIHNSGAFKDTQLLQEEEKPDSFAFGSMAHIQIMEIRKFIQFSKTLFSFPPTEK